MARNAGDRIYSRYISNHDGTFRRSTVPTAQAQRPSAPKPQQQASPPPSRPASSPPPYKPAGGSRPCAHPEKPLQFDLQFLKRLLPDSFDMGDLLVILIVLLLMLENQEDTLNILITAAICLLL